MNRAKRSRTRDELGFTLIEVLVALTIAASVVLAARALLHHVGEAADRLIAVATEADREANTEQWMRRLVAQADAGAGEGRFLGDRHAVRFPTWCEMPAGWQERCLAMLAIVPADDGLALVLAIDEDPVVVRRGIEAAALRYLYSAERGGIWLGSWQSPVSLPLAVGVIIEADTLILRIGERG